MCATKPIPFEDVSLPVAPSALVFAEETLAMSYPCRKSVRFANDSASSRQNRKEGDRDAGQ